MNHTVNYSGFVDLIRNQDPRKPVVSDFGATSPPVPQEPPRDHSGLAEKDDSSAVPG